TAFTLITIQALMGGFDNLWHHEITERLPARRSAANELALHALRELLYGFVFFAIAWYRWQGAWAILIGGVLALEVLVTLADFVVEDRTRHLPPLERVLHTLMALNYGAVLAFVIPMLIGWSKLQNAVVAISHAYSWAFSLFGAGALAWSVRNAFAVLTLRRPPEWVRNPIAAGRTTTPRNILVSGATGFIGGHLVPRLIQRGEKVIVYTRNPEVALDKFGPHVRIVNNLDDLDASTYIDAIVNLAGAPILSMPWTKARRQHLLASRIDTTRALTTLIGRLTRPVRVFVSASAIGYYGVRGEEILDEQARPTEDFQSQLCQEWEAAARAAARLGARLVRMRIGLVLGRDGGALPQLARPVRLGLGAILGSGRQWVSWIHIDDLVRLFEFALDTPRVNGAFNAVSPAPVTHRQFQASMARILKRPLWLRVPAALIRRALGEMAQLLVDGQRVVPARATSLGFQFRHTQIQEALGDLLRGEAVGNVAADIYFNDQCPVCNAEMSHYAGLCAKARPDFHFIPATQHPDALAQCGLRQEHLARRVYLHRPDGVILSGMPALIALWSTMPRYRWLSRLVALPLLREITVMLYDHVIAPTLAFWASRRQSTVARAT
ncbi:MAG: TIGR01777 family oxidoreductase, partial [Steroidobacteraceae bacterium]